MNGPQHYREAEKLLAGANPSWDGEFRVQMAQAHATLALAAATAAQLTGQFLELDEDAFAWAEVAGTPPRGITDVQLPEYEATS